MKILRMIVVGMLIALSCSYILVTISVLSDDTALVTGAELLEQIIIAAILGACIGPLSIIFELERWPLVLQLLLHLTLITILVMTAGYFGGWFEHFGFINVLISEAIIYILVWSMMYLLHKKEVAQINEAIKRRKEN